MVVTGHTPNFLPGVSVVTKIARADVFVVCDEMQYERHGFCNRNRLDGRWLTVPVNEHDTFQPMNRVRIADPVGRHREKIARTLEHRLGADAAPFAFELRRPWQRLAGLNVALLAHLLGTLDIGPEWVLQSHLAASHDEDTVSERLAAMTAEVGGTVWLSGPSGRTYLDETPFAERGIAIVYHEHEGPNPSAVELLRERVAA